MSVMDEGVIDFAGLEKKERRLVLSIIDHLEWGQEADDVHLIMLQSKSNDYLSFIESGEVNECFDPEEYEEVLIRIIAKYPFYTGCIDFLNKCKSVINDAGFGLEWKIGSTENENK